MQVVIVIEKQNDNDNFNYNKMEKNTQLFIQWKITTIEPPLKY